MKKKLKLNELDVKSFVTKLDDNDMPTLVGASVSAGLKRLFGWFVKKADDVVPPLPRTMNLYAPECKKFKSELMSCPEAELCIGRPHDSYPFCVVPKK